MDKLISIEKVIKEAKKKGVDFGKSDPHNRLRYYTKIGWIPHTIRQKNETGIVKGHYPTWVVERLTFIEDLKRRGLSNDAITQKLSAKNKLARFIELLKDKGTRNQLIAYASFGMLAAILLSEIGILEIGTSKNYLVNESIAGNATITQILDSGTAFIPAGQETVFVKTPYINRSMKVNVTFREDFQPASRYWVEQIKDFEGFTLRVNAPVADSVEFHWIVTN
jgi:hypothetical protein